jgi:hypothetical protein
MQEELDRERESNQDYYHECHRMQQEFDTKLAAVQDENARLISCMNEAVS